jgi:hypothetical protein
VFIPEFYEATSLISLMDAVDSRLMQNYYRFEELLLRLRFEAATTVLFNDNGRVTTTAGDVGVGDGGTCTRAYLDALYFYLFSQRVPTMPDGNYCIVLPPTAASQLKASLGEQYRPVTEEQMQAVTNIFRVASGVEIGRASGYIGDYCNFHIFAGNSFGVGSAGSVPTVNSVSFGAGATVCEDAFAFGPGAVGRGIALPVEVRMQQSPYSLGSGFIWVSREGVANIDTDSSLDAAQQTRVFKCRFARVAV